MHFNTIRCFKEFTNTATRETMQDVPTTGEKAVSNNKSYFLLLKCAEAEI